MEALIRYVCEELKDIEKKAEKGQLSMAEVDYADKLAHLKKNLLKGEEMMADEGYSNRGYSRRYDDNMSYGYSRAGRINARRDPMGRYSRYSIANDEMIAELHDLMQNAPDEHTKKEFRTFIDKLERM